MSELRFFEIYRSNEYLELLINGIFISGCLTVSAGILGFLAALGLAIIRYWNIPIISFICAAYIDFIRNTPLIVQLFFVAFGLPGLIGYVWPFWGHALLGLTINFSGYFAEISDFLQIIHTSPQIITLSANKIGNFRQMFITIKPKKLYFSFGE